MYLTDADKITCCKMCTLATIMRDCKRCRFNIGLPFKAIKTQETQDEDIKILLSSTKQKLIKLV